MGTKKEIDIQDILKQVRLFMPSKVILLAHQFNIFDLIEAGHKTLEQITGESETSGRGMGRLLDSLCALGMLTKTEDSYENVDSLKGYLLRDSPDSVRNYLELIHKVSFIWSDMDIVIRDGMPIVTMMELIGESEEMLHTFVNAMEERAREASQLIPETVDISKSLNMLDIGSGPGTYSLTWLQQYPKLNATLLDLKIVLAIAEKRVQALGLGKRTTLLPGDFREVMIRDSYDLVLIANVLQMYGPEDNMKLIRKAYDALSKDGLLIFHGYTREEDGAGPLPSVIFSLSIAGVTENGDAYKKSEMTGWLEEVGFKDIEFKKIKAVPETVMTALKK